MFPKVFLCLVGAMLSAPAQQREKQTEPAKQEARPPGQPARGQPQPQQRPEQPKQQPQQPKQQAQPQQQPRTPQQPKQQAQPQPQQQQRTPQQPKQQAQPQQQQQQAQPQRAQQPKQQPAQQQQPQRAQQPRPQQGQPQRQAQQSAPQRQGGQNRAYAPPQRAPQQAQAWQQRNGFRAQGAWPGRATFQENRSAHWSSDHRDWGQRGGYGGYYIPQASFGLYFGSDHYFRIGSQPFIVGGYPRFRYGGYTFMIVDPWPYDWGTDWYSADEVYVGYDDGYYLYNRNYPGEAVAIAVVM